MFSADDMKPGLAEFYPALSQEQRLYRGLEELTAEVLGRKYYREQSGDELTIERCLIDAGWLPQVVYQFVRASTRAGVIYPSKGIGRTLNARGVSEWKMRPGERRGYHWRLTQSETGKGRMVQFDPDAWKSFLFERFTTPIGGGGTMRMFGKSAAMHEMLSEHCTAEISAPVTLRGSTFDKWHVKHHRPDNHWLDCIVGCCLAASVQGLTLNANSMGRPEVKEKKRKLNIEDLYAKAQQGNKG
jgi:phage terminase large subunit GpA-like protein